MYRLRVLVYDSDYAYLRSLARRQKKSMAVYVRAVLHAYVVTLKEFDRERCNLR